MSKELSDLVRSLVCCAGQPRVLCSLCVTQAERGDHVALELWLRNNVHSNLDGIAHGTCATHWPTVAFMSLLHAHVLMCGRSGPLATWRIGQTQYVACVCDH